MQSIASDEREAETTRAGPQGERGCKGASEKVETGKLSKGGKWCERAKVEADGAVNIGKSGEVKVGKRCEEGAEVETGGQSKVGKRRVEEPELRWEAALDLYSRWGMLMP